MNGTFHTSTNSSYYTVSITFGDKTGDTWWRKNEGDSPKWLFLVLHQESGLIFGFYHMSPKRLCESQTFHLPPPLSASRSHFPFWEEKKNHLLDWRSLSSPLLCTHSCRSYGLAPNVAERWVICSEHAVSVITPVGLPSFPLSALPTVFTLSFMECLPHAPLHFSLFSVCMGCIKYSRCARQMVQMKALLWAVIWKRHTKTSGTQSAAVGGVLLDAHLTFQTHSVIKEQQIFKTHTKGQGRKHENSKKKKKRTRTLATVLFWGSFLLKLALMWLFECSQVYININ